MQNASNFKIYLLKNYIFILKVEVTYGEWKSLESEVAMLKEHNELLVRQAKLHQAKLQDLLRSYQSRGKLNF